MKKIALFGHDAGGSELILELASASSQVGEFHIFCTQDSPCFTLAKEKNLQKHVHIIQNSKEFIFKELNTLNSSLILYSTGWQNHIEYNFLAYAKEFNIPSVAFLDNWGNYRERFGYPAKNWEENLPSYIAVHDQTSEELAISLGLPNVIAIKNYALLSQLESLKNTGLKESETLLFLSEPTAKVAQNTFQDSYYWGFDVISGFSDYTMGSTVPIVAVALGAKVIEKHFILDKSMGGADADFSMDKQEFTQMIQAVRDTEKLLGSVTYSMDEKKRKSRHFSRSLYISEEIKKGEIFTEQNIRSVRPGYGLHPKYFKDILGKHASEGISFATPLSWKHIQ